MEPTLSFDNKMLIHDLFAIMSEVLAYRDYPTYVHTIRVSRIAKKIGEAMGLPAEQLDILELAGLVHDIGKTAIPDDILLKPNLFNLQDRRIMEYHPLIGAKFFARRLLDDSITYIILRHHERLDGSGYPLGLKGNQIDRLSRITAVADVFEAMSAKRPYKKALPQQSVLEILKHEVSLHHLDGEAVNALCTIADSLILDNIHLYSTAGFMEEIENFRRDTFFRDTLSELYNYRYLLVLDDLNILGEDGSMGYELQLINFGDYGKFQRDYGFIVASQVHDEIGQRLKETVACFQKKRKRYDGSIMLFRKHCDYMIYSEANSEEDLAEFLGQIKAELELSHSEWGLEAQCFRGWFERNVSIEAAITHIFNLENRAMESCKKS
ncbi:MAG: HD domain-containing protein [Desulfobulbaceae bacterium]|nr:HD domain-containing protein [Desulfobulbaceae bacterium]